MTLITDANHMTPQQKSAWLNYNNQHYQASFDEFKKEYNRLHQKEAVKKKPKHNRQSELYKPRRIKNKRPSNKTSLIKDFPTRLVAKAKQILADDDGIEPKQTDAIISLCVILLNDDPKKYSLKVQELVKRYNKKDSDQIIYDKQVETKKKIDQLYQMNNTLLNLLAYLIGTSRFGFGSGELVNTLDDIKKIDFADKFVREIVLDAMDKSKKEYQDTERKKGSDWNFR